MKQNILFKTLIDLLLFLQCFGLLVITLVLPNNMTIGNTKISLEEWNFTQCVIFTLSCISYLIFLIALYYLRKLARNYLSNQIFSNIISANLKRSGNYFILYGLFSIIAIIIQCIQHLTGHEFSYTYDLNSQLTLFTIIIGVFFIIQSKVLSTAKSLQEENDLTV